MKKLFLAAFAIVIYTSVNAQTFGVKAGLDFASSKQEGAGVSASGSETAPYFGVFAQIEISEKFKFQGEIHMPLMANYSVSDKFSILAGPAIGLFIDAADSLNSFNYGIEAGGAYDISESFLVEARYNIGLANLAKDAPDGFSNKLSGFYIGVGYKF